MTTLEAPADKADHRPYIETVRATLLMDDIYTGVATFSTTRVRSAAMTLLPPDDDFDEPWHHTFAHAEHVELRWTEEEGWSVLALHSYGERRLPTIWRYGFDVVLPPDEVRTWLAVLLTMPGIAPSQENGPYRSHQTHDPALEASLAAYVL